MDCGSTTGFSQIVLLLEGSLIQDELYTGQINQLQYLKPEKKIYQEFGMDDLWDKLFNRERLYGKHFYLFFTVHLSHSLPMIFLSN